MAEQMQHRTLTLDANVVSYYFRFVSKRTVPSGLRVRRIADFCYGIVDRCPIAWNPFIKEEYERVVGFVPTKNWLAIRLRKGLVREIECASLPPSIKSALGDDYGFDCRSRDVRYLETCFNTALKHLVTENREHFLRSHRKRNRRTMPAFLKQKLSICVCTIDQSCDKLLSG